MSLADLDDRHLDAEYARKILTFDIETVPAKVAFETYDLKLRNPYISPKYVIEPGYMACWSAKWLHDPHSVIHMNTWQHGHQAMLEGLWQLVDEASYVITYNGDKFDLQKLRGYAARHGMLPFRPARSIDLIKTVRTFKFESASLDYACRMFDVRRKVDNGGAGNVQAAVAGDRTHQRNVRVYCNGDVRATEELYLAIRPWIRNHPVIGYPADMRLRCPRCLSPHHEEVGVVQAVVMRYRQHRCGNCGGLFRSMHTHRVSEARAL